MSSDWLEDTRRRLTIFQKEFEREFQADSKVGGFRLRPWLAACAACLLTAAVIGSMLRLSKPAHVPSPSSVIRNIDQSDARLDGETIHQVFKVEEFQVRPKGPARRTRLEIWSDARSRCFASKWTGVSGSLKSGRWLTDAGSLFVYSPERGRTVQMAEGNSVLPAFSKIEPDVDVLEAGFMQWLKDRPWKPIASLADLSLWERQGALMQVQRVSTGVLRLVIRQEIRGVQVEFLALIDEANYSLRIQRIRLETGDRAVEFQLSSELTERPLSVSPAVFYPDRSIPTAKLVRGEAFAMNRPILPVRADAPKPGIVLSSDSSTLIRRVEAYYVLHEAGACRGTPVTVSAQDGGVRVSGQKPVTESSNSYFTNIANVSDVMGALSEIRDSDEQLPGSLPSGSSSVDGRDSFRQLLLDADALKTLASAFDQSQTRLLPDASIRLLESMVQDHAASLSKTLAALSDPVKYRIGDTHYAQDEAAAADWRDLATTVIKAVRALAISGSPDVASLQARVEGLMHTVDELTARSQVELNRDQNSAAIRKSRNRK